MVALPAGLQALCAEASLAALRRVYPQIYTSDVKLLIDPSAVRVTRADFTAAMKGEQQAPCCCCFCRGVWLLSSECRRGLRLLLQTGGHAAVLACLLACEHMLLDRGVSVRGLALAAACVPCRHTIGLAHAARTCCLEVLAC